MALHPTPANCERARAWVSLRLDGELSELEEALLASHLERCSACREYDGIVSSAVLTLRAQTPEQVSHPVSVPGRRRTFLAPAGLARIAAVAAAVVGLTTILSTQSTHRPAATAPAPASVSVIDNDAKQFRALRVLQLGGRPPRNSGVGQFGPDVNSRRP